MDSNLQGGLPVRAEPLPPLPLGGRYERLGRIAIGGMAEIFAAEAIGPSGPLGLVALKRVRPHVAHDPEFVERFLAEARTAARVDHPNVCRVLELVVDGDDPLLVLEYLEGATVGALLRGLIARRRALNPRLAVGIAVQALDGLHAAHELTCADGVPAGLVHRDVSPGNLFLTVQGAVKVLDFGIAKSCWTTTETRAGTRLGKCDYMAPEQAEGKDLDRRADVFALSIVLHELLTGRRLFRRASEHESLRAVLRDVPCAPSQANPAIPAALDEVVLSGLCRDRERRYPTAAAMRRALEAALVRHGGVAGPRELAGHAGRVFAPEVAARRAALLAARRLPRRPAAAAAAPEVDDDAATIELEVTTRFARLEPRARRPRATPEAGSPIGPAATGGPAVREATERLDPTAETGADGPIAADPVVAASVEAPAAPRPVERPHPILGRPGHPRARRLPLATLTTTTARPAAPALEIGRGLDERRAAARRGARRAAIVAATLLAALAALAAVARRDPAARPSPAATTTPAP